METPASAIDLTQRWKMQKQNDSRLRPIGGSDSGQAWSYGTGDYSLPTYAKQGDPGTANLFGINQTMREIGDVESLRGVEWSIGKLVENMLSNCHKKPIVVFDYGGGVGLSWCRLAKRFEKEIVSGDLVLAVSNYEENYYVEVAIGAENLNLSNNERDIITYAKKHRLVNYVRGELAGADSQKITSLRQLRINDRTRVVPLVGNVDIVHVRLSLSHSLVPEIHFPRLFELLSKDGVYIDSEFTSETPAYPADQPGLQWKNSKGGKHVVLNPYTYVLNEMDMEVVPTIEEGENAGMKIWATILRKKNSKVTKIQA